MATDEDRAPEADRPRGTAMSEAAAEPLPPVAPGERHLILVDGSGYIFRAYHALPPMTNPQGVPVNAVYGFTTMLSQFLTRHAGTHIAVVFDAARINFRNEIYADYKAHRPDPPEDLVPQFDLIREATDALGVCRAQHEGFEADDLIAAYAKAFLAEGPGQVTIVSSDKDLMQLVRPGVQLLDPIKQKPIREPEVFEKFGVTPDKVVEVQALAGDSTDNVPGVPGIGIKTAAQLITEYGDLESLLANADKIKQPKRREALVENAEKARISRRLVLLDENAPLPCPIGDMVAKPPPDGRLESFLRAMGFRSLLARMGKLGEGNDPRAAARRPSRSRMRRPPARSRRTWPCPSAPTKPSRPRTRWRAGSPRPPQQAWWRWTPRPTASMRGARRWWASPWPWHPGVPATCRSAMAMPRTCWRSPRPRRCRPTAPSRCCARCWKTPPC